MSKFVAVAVLCLSASAFAADKSQSRPATPAPQHGFLESHNLTIGVDTGAAMPIGNYSDVNGIGMGLYANAELALLDTISGTLRIGFEGHLDKSSAGFDSHVNALPILIGGKAWLGQQRQGVFGTFEMGLFDLMSTVTVNGASSSASDMKFGMGLGGGYQQGPWNARLALYTHDVGNFGDAMMLTLGVGYSFAGL